MWIEDKEPKKHDQKENENILSVHCFIRLMDSYQIAEDPETLQPKILIFAIHVRTL